MKNKIERGYIMELDHLYKLASLISFLCTYVNTCPN